MKIEKKLARQAGKKKCKLSYKKTCTYSEKKCKILIRILLTKDDSIQIGKVLQ